MPDRNLNSKLRAALPACLTALLAILCATTANAGTVSVEVKTSDTGLLQNGLRWILEEDATYDVDPANPPVDPFDAAAFQLHTSYMPVARTGESVLDAGGTFTIAGVDEARRYYLSVMPNQPDLNGSECGPGEGCYTMTGTPVRFAGATTANVVVTLTPQPMPSAQARIRVFDDRGLINNWPDPGEGGLGDFVVFIYDAGGGPLVTDVFGNPLGTTYDEFGEINVLGTGALRTMNEAEVGSPLTNPLGLAVGELQIQNLAPGKYGIQVVPPAAPPGEQWQQTTTIEGTKGIDVWIRAGEPTFAVEFGPTLTQAFFGMVKEFSTLNGSHTVNGTVTNLRMQRPPNGEFLAGQELGNCWIGLNDDTGVGRYAGPCPDGGSEFSIPNVPEGTYNLIVWDKYLLSIIGFNTVIVDGASPQTIDLPLGSISVPLWFANHTHFVFNDLNGNGIRDAGEPGLPEQAINIRYRDGSIYFASATDLDGFLPLEEVFPFFSFLIAEVDFARFKATGLRVTVDEGGEIPAACDPDDPLEPSNCVRTPQVQPGGSLQRIETINAATCDGLPATDCEVVGGPPLIEAYNSFAGTDHKFEWAKQTYQKVPDGQGGTRFENGGISGVIYYQTTRAENDPRFAAPEPWEPGIPRVPVMLYRANADGVIQNTNSEPGIQLSDIDYYPFGWADGGAMGAEDVERSVNGGVGVFDMGDAIEVASTDSFDDTGVDGCVNDTLITDGRCYDSLRNWSQVRPGVFDGGYGLGAPWSDLYLAPGKYVVEAAAPAGYEHQDELSKNVDFGDTFIPQQLPPVCVGDPIHTGGQQDWNVVGANAPLELFGGVDVDSRYTGNRPLCNFKVVHVKDKLNAAADFFLYTEVPVAGHIQGNVLNDINNATRANDPNFGEKISAANIPISIRDYAGNEVNRVYTDANGRYNGLVPSTYRINAPMPTGVSPNMVRICLNPPTKADPSDPTLQVEDPFHNPQYSQNCYTFNFAPGQTTYLDTPVLPVGAFVDLPDWQLDCSYPDGTPVIRAVGAGGPIIDLGEDSEIQIFSEGLTTVKDPSMPRPGTIQRDFGFGSGGTAWLIQADGTRVALTTNDWTNSSLKLIIPNGSITTGGQLEIIRGDNGLKSVHGITLIAMTDPSQAVVVAGGGAINGAIQAAIDAAPVGGVVLVPPGTYYEPVIITRPVQLQGYGAGVTIINAGRAANQQLLIDWRANVNKRVNCDDGSVPAQDRIGLLPGQRNNVQGFTAAENCGFRPETGLFAAEEMAGVLVAPVQGAFGGAMARIDGLTITSADYSGGIIVNAYATGLQISNNIVRNNQGLSAGGIRIGHSNLFDENGEVVDAENDNIRIHHNYVSQNSSTFENGGGLGLYNGTDNYDVSANYFCGNFTQGDGAGIAHYGRSPGGLIKGNQILFNQSFDQTAAKRGGNGGGIFVSGPVQDGAAPIQLTAGSGSVRIIGNKIQGNQSGSGDGSAIALQSVNGQDMLVTVPGNRESVEILNNMITNNVAGYAGAVSLQDAVNVSIIHNTIVNNDSTATVAAAFGANLNQTDPQPAGIISRAHSAELLALNAAGAGQFSNAVINNNIILGNRSMHWESVVGLVAGTNPFWDLEVIGAAGDFSPSRNILSSEGGRNAAYTGSNTLLSVASEDALLATPYVNGDTGVASPFDIGDFQTVPVAAGALDEGGNFLTAVYGPLSRVGDYHLQAGSTAIDTASITNMLGFASLFADIDGDPRPVYGESALLPDVGADEVAAHASPPELAPRIISMPSPSAQNGVLYSYQVVAVDANQVGGFTYSVQRCNNSGSNCNQNLETAAINGSGLFTWTPASNGRRNYRITVCDSTVRCDTQNFSLFPYNSSAPIARHDPNANGNGFIEVSVMGQFTLGAPGVLRNDSTGNNNQPELLTPMIGNVAALPAGSTVSLATNGSFSLKVPTTWTGTTSFTYTVSDGVYPTPSVPATVSLRRRAIITNATFTDSPGTANDSWNISGYGGNFGGATGGNMRVSVYLIPAAGGEGAATPVFIGASNAFSRAGAIWNVNTTGISLAAGGTLTVREGNGNPNGTILLQGVVPSILYNGAGATTSTTVFVQCPGDSSGQGLGVSTDPAIWCKHLTAGDGFIKLADGNDLYTFGFSDATGIAAVDSISEGLLDANFPAPTLVFEQGHEAYLTLSNAGTILRPDLFDPHTVHFHGFPNASAQFDGVPESSVAINGGFSLTYYYNVVDPGTFMYHCHVEASEHMQMGMLGNLYVHPAQDGELYSDQMSDGSTKSFTSFVYNDGDGTTGYDIEVPIQIGAMDRNYHDEHLLVQPLPFAFMHDDYPMLNGRGYPDTVNAATTGFDIPLAKADAGVPSSDESSQQVSTVIQAGQGDRILLRISNLNVTQFSTLATNGLPMKVVGMGAHILRGPGGENLYYETNSITLGGGEAVDVLIDTTDVSPGTYVLYSTNLNDLSNGAEDFGGMMTEIVIN